jgi:hypothetical protein
MCVFVLYIGRLRPLCLYYSNFYYEMQIWLLQVQPKGGGATLDPTPLAWFYTRQAFQVVAR